MKDILKLSASSAVGKTPRTIVVGEPTWLASIGRSNPVAVPDLRLAPTLRSAALEAGLLFDAELLVIEVDAGEFATLARLEAARRAYPDLPIIAAVQNADIRVMRTLLRHGVTNVVALPFDAEELAAEIYNVGARMAEAEEITLAPTACIVGTLGRSGASSILLHLADALVHGSDRSLRCCVIDLDIQAGQMASYAGIESTRSVQDLLEAEDRLDQDMIRNLAIKARTGVYVIAAPQEILPLEQVDVDQVGRIIQLARSEFDIVLIDLPPSWTNWSLSVAAQCDRLVIVTQQSLAHLRHARRQLELFHEVGIEREKINLVVNRASRSRFSKITLHDVAETLDTDVLAAIREDRGELAQAQDEGRFVSEVSRKNGFARDVADLASAVAALLGEKSA